MADPQPEANFTPPPGTPDTFTNPTAPFLNPGQPQQPPDMASTFGFAPLAPGFVRDARGNLTMNGRQPDRFMPDPNAPPGSDSVPQWAVSPPQQNSPLAIPPEADQLVKVIEAHELTPGRSEWQLYGGQVFQPGAEHPKDMGWGGDRGPDGRPTSAAGPGQWERDTWRDEAKKIAALGIEPNFGDMAQQRWAMWDLGSRSYQARTGRNLQADIQAGKADWQALGSVWQGLQSGVAPHLVSGSYNPPAQGLVDQIMRNMQAEQPGMQEAISEAKDLHSMARAMAAKWMADGDKPPQNMRQAWSQWGTVAGALALFGGLFGHGHMVAALGAAGSMLQAANSADQQAYDRSYKQWQDHLNNGIKAIEMLNKEAMDIITDSKLGYDQQVAQLQILSTAAGVQQKLDPQSAENIQRQLDKANAVNGIIKMNNIDASFRNKVSEWVADPANASKVVTDPATGQKTAPPDVQSKLRAAAEQEAKPDNLGAIEKQIQLAAYSTALENGKKQYYDAHPEAQGKPIPAKDMEGIELQARVTAGMPGAVSAQKQNQANAAVAAFTDSDVHYWANVVRAGGALPPNLGRTASGSQLIARIMKEVGATGTPGDFIEAHATVHADSSSLNNLTKMTDAAVSFERTARENFDLALNLAPNAVPSDLGPFFNRWIEEGDKMLGDPNVPQYVTAMITAANEYAKIMSGSTGAQGSTVDSRKEATELFSPYLSYPQIRAVVAVAEKDMENRKGSLYGQIDDVKARLRAAGTHEPTATQGQGRPVEAAQPRGQTSPQSAPAAGVVIQNGWRYDAKTHQPLGPVQ